MRDSEHERLKREKEQNPLPKYKEFLTRVENKFGIKLLGLSPQEVRHLKSDIQELRSFSDLFNNFFSVSGLNKFDDPIYIDANRITSIE